ncbi:MAG: peptide methionine sulfoxide reductase [Planctomycetota bacterium]
MLVALLDRIPEGSSERVVEGRRWAVTKVTSTGGRAVRLFGEELGGTGYVSANAYLVGGRWILCPCEMPAERVLAFLRRL